MAFLTGASQAANVAAARLKPINFRKSLREEPPSSLSLLIGRYSGNSRSAFLTNSGSLVNCSSPFQYVFLFSFILCKKKNVLKDFKLVVALCALQAPDVFDFQCVFRIRMKLHQLIIILVALSTDIRLSVTINTPSHGQ